MYGVRLKVQASRFSRLAALWSVLSFILSCSPVTAFGINQTGLAWVKSDTEWEGTIDAMTGSGAHDIRIMLVQSIRRTSEVAEYATRKGMGVLIMVPLTQLIYYPDGTVRRRGKGLIWPSPPFSRLDINLVETRVRAALQRFAASGVRITGIEVANEFNSAAFNGDLPFVKGGAILDFANHREFRFWTDYSAGMEKLVEAIAAIKKARDASETYIKVPVILGGLARPSTTWLRNMDASLVEPDLALKTLIDLGVDRYVDAYAIHLYPKVPADQWTSPHDAIARHVDEHMTPVVAVSGPTKPWWITEWGFAKRHDMTPGPDGADPRLPLFRAFPEVVAQSRYARLFGPTFIFDWDESQNFRIWDGGRVLGTTNFFPQAARSSAPPLPAAPRLGLPP